MNNSSRLRGQAVEIVSLVHTFTATFVILAHRSRRIVNYVIVKTLRENETRIFSDCIYNSNEIQKNNANEFWSKDKVVIYIQQRNTIQIYVFMFVRYVL